MIIRTLGKAGIQWVNWLLKSDTTELYFCFQENSANSGEIDMMPSASQELRQVLNVTLSFPPLALLHFIHVGEVGI